MKPGLLPPHQAYDPWGDLRSADAEATRLFSEDQLVDRAKEATAPLNVVPPTPDQDYGATSQLPMKNAWGSPIRHPQAISVEFFGLLLCMIGPCLVFTSLMMIMNAERRFSYPTIYWLIAFIFLLPALLAFRYAGWSVAHGGRAPYARLSAWLLLAAFIAGAVIGNLIYWFFIQPFYQIEALKTYANIKPSKGSGVLLMDAGRVHFSENTNLALDMAMSYTGWDTYCVAPITTPSGMPSQGSRLQSYDVWAVGKNCCGRGATNFHCGEFDNPKARSGLRAVNEGANNYFALAVQQAEAAYHIRAQNPVFFYWVEDAEAQQHYLFSKGFTIGVLCLTMQFVVNGFTIAVWLMLFHLPPRKAVNLFSLGREGH